MTNILERPWTFTVINTVIAGVIMVSISVGFFDRTILEAAILGIAMALTMSFTLIYLQRADAAEN